ncbi:MAG: VOC family protein [Mycobacterium sp.]|uniref:VOC family protein n=1 Tax=Mycobacterium sp. TaxID=1785 RepID=UPI003F966558
MSARTSSATSPGITGVHHLSLTVTDLDASLDWYRKVFRTDHNDTQFPHYDRQDTGYGVLVTEPRSGLVFGLHTNVSNQGEAFSETRTGLDHVSFKVASRSDLEAWTAWLDELDVTHTGIRDLEEPFVYSTVVLRDPDGIQLELFASG